MQKVTRFFAFAPFLLLGAAFPFLALTGCTSSVVANLPGTAAATGDATITPSLITDAPADQVLALGLTVSSIRLFDAAGKYADVLTSPTTIEAAHLDAVQEPLHSPLNIPQDTYTSALITVSNPTVTYVDTSSRKPVQATATLTSSLDVVTFTTPITISSTSAPLCFDLLVAQSVVLTGTSAAVTPTFNVVSVPLAHQPTNGSNGRVNDIFGSFVSATPSSLTMLTANGTQVVIDTDSSTTFQGFTSLSALTVGQLLDVDVAQQSNGSLLALRIHASSATVFNELVGPVTSLTGKPASSFVLAVRQTVGPATAGVAAGTPYTVTVTGSTTFSSGPQLGVLPTLPFAPVFTAATIIPGQNVAVEASTLASTAATATAASVTLVPQTVSGVVSAITTSGGFSVYTVTLPAGSALGSLSGVSSVVVYSNTNTQFTTASQVIVGSTVRFNGLLFNDNGTLRLLSGACSDPTGLPFPQRH